MDKSKHDNAPTPPTKPPELANSADEFRLLLNEELAQQEREEAGYRDMLARNVWERALRIVAIR